MASTTVPAGGNVLNRHERALRAQEYVIAERDRAIAKHGYQQTPAWPYMSDKDRLVILIEEVGEVARAMTYDEGDKVALLKELVQVAAMALMWIEGEVRA